MSFLRKLFRGDTQPLADGTTAPADERPVVAEEAGGRVAAGTVDAAEERAAGPTGEPSAEPATAPAERGAVQEAPMEGDETPWWEEATAENAPAEVAALEPASAEMGAPEPSQAAPSPSGDEDAAATADVSTEPGAPIPGPVEEEGTRPLTAADRPELVALRSRQGFAAAALRDIGRVRSVNQDSIFALTTTLPRESSDVSMGLFVVADGMGGHAGGEIASRLAISAVARHVLAELVMPALADAVTEALQPLIVSAVQEANRAIWEHAQAVGSDMGTTCTVALLLGQALYIGHVGDSRAYLVTPTGLRLITSDHSTVGRLIQLGQLDPAEAREHPLRSQLYRTVGQHPEVLVDFIYQPIGDATHLLICSDGLWGMLDEDVLLDVLEHAIWPQDACRELIARANLAGGEDNISALVVTLPVHT